MNRWINGWILNSFGSCLRWSCPKVGPETAICIQVTKKTPRRTAKRMEAAGLGRKMPIKLRVTKGSSAI